MIQSTSLLSLLPSFSQGAARQPGGGAFVLPDGDDAVGDIAASLADEDGSERQDDAAGGNGLPATVPAIDPWLVATLLSPDIPSHGRTADPTAPTVTATPAVAVASHAALASASAPATPVVPGAGKSSVVARDLVNRPAVAPSIDTVQDLVADRPAPAATQIETTPPATAASANLPGSARTPAMTPAGERERPRDLATSRSPSARIAPSTVDRSISVPDGSTGAGAVAPSPTAGERRPGGGDVSMASVTRPVPVDEPGIDRSTGTREPSETPAASTLARSADPTPTPADVSAVASPMTARAPTRPRDPTLPGTALRSSALTPLHRHEVATVAALVSATLPQSIDAPSSGDALPVTAAPGAGSREIAGSSDPAARRPPVAPTEAKTTTVGPAASAPIVRVDVPSTPASTLPPGWRQSSSTPATPSPTLQPDAATPPNAPPLATRVGEAAVFAGSTAGRPAIAEASLPGATSSVATALTSPVSAPAAAPEAPSPQTSAPTAAVSPAQPPLPQPTAPAAAAPSSVVFGAARYAAQTSDPREERPPAIVGGSVGSTALAQQPAIAAAPVAQAPLDVRHERWPTAMIKRIEMIRDAANEADTRIRLVPDALGAIDVDVRRDGDMLHVRFTAEQPQTRALLQEAVPRLADAAEARGLRLGQTTVGGDSSGLAQQQSQQGRQPPLPAAPARPRQFTADAATADADDPRLA